MGRIRNLWVFLGLLLFTVSICDFHVSADVIPSENECRPYIEKAIHELKNVEATASDDKESTEAKLDDIDSIETEAAPETGTEDDGNDSAEEAPGKLIDDDNQSDADAPSQENQTEENASNEETAEEKPAEDADSKEQDDSKEQNEGDEKSGEGNDGDDDDSKEVKAEDKESQEQPDGDSKEEKSDTDDDSKEGDSKEQQPDTDGDSKEQTDGDSKEDADNGDAKDSDDDSKENGPEDGNDSKENDADDDNNDSTQTEETLESAETANAATESEQANDGSNEESTENEKTNSAEDSENQTAENDADSKEDDDATTAEANDDSKEDSKENDSQDAQNDTNEDSVEEKVRAKRSIPEEADSTQSDEQQESAQNDDSQETANDSTDNDSQENTAEAKDDDDANDSQEGESQEAAEDASEEEQDEDDLTIEFEIPKNLRPRGHVSDLLGLDAESSIKENALRRTGDVVLKDLKKVFDNAIKPLETMYKYRDLSNRHFGDPEIFSKPLILFMGPWSGGKSTILNYLTENEYTPNSIRSGAEPSPAYFNILMHGDEPEVLDGTQLAADWTFSGLQKFGQGLMDRLRGQKLPSKLLERVNIVEIPGILEVRKHVSRYFPFNDACQWFIDRADIIFLVYDPSKLDVGPETEAILDQLKGREYQTRILLNKADQVKPEELLRVQGALIWNISPLMSSAQPPVMYTVSLWSHPFESGSPIRLLQAQERAFLSDLREAIDRRIENKIASARRFAVRIRNHAKMVDCYLTTYYNQKGLFSNKKQVSDKIIEHPQNYNIYEGLSTLTNISRYDLPDPEVYLDFFRLNPLYEFKKLSETCTYFKGCPINKLDIAIAYELPELVGKYKKLQEQNLIQLRKEYDENCNQTETELPVKIIKS